jgi:hypothetical protein
MVERLLSMRESIGINAQLPHFFARTLKNEIVTEYLHLVSLCITSLTTVIFIFGEDTVYNL